MWFNGNGLGVSRDGVDVGVDPKWNDIYTDCGGGDGGVPAESQLLGAIVRVACELPKYELNRVHTLASYNPSHPLLSGGLGSVYMPEIGSFVRQGSTPLGGTLEIRGKNGRILFPFGFLRQPQDFNVGTKATTKTLGWECWLEDFTARKLLDWLAAI